MGFRYKQNTPGSNITPKWIIGFTDARGKFHVSRRGKNSKEGAEFRFVISVQANLCQQLYAIKTKLGVGKVKINQDINQATYTVTRPDHLRKYIIPFYDRFGPLLTTRQAEFLALDYALKETEKGVDLTNDDLERIRKISLAEYLHSSPLKQVDSPFDKNEEASSNKENEEESSNEENEEESSNEENEEESSNEENEEESSNKENEEESSNEENEEESSNKAIYSLLYNKYNEDEEREKGEEQKGQPTGGSGAGGEEPDVKPLLNSRLPHYDVTGGNVTSIARLGGWPMPQRLHRSSLRRTTQMQLRQCYHPSGNMSSQSLSTFPGTTSARGQVPQRQPPQPPQTAARKLWSPSAARLLRLLA